jgi:LTXXQ motif family protein
VPARDYSGATCGTVAVYAIPARGIGHGAQYRAAAAPGFEQSLNADQQSRLAVGSSQEVRDRQTQSGNIAGGCVSPGEIEWSIHEINQSVQPTTTQRDALKRSFDEAAKDLEAHCPTTIPTTALSRLDTIQARLDSTWRATLSIQVALANFEAELSDAQKVRFDTLNFAAQ